MEKQKLMNYDKQRDRIFTENGSTEVKDIQRESISSKNGKTNIEDIQRERIYWCIVRCTSVAPPPTHNVGQWGVASQPFTHLDSLVHFIDERG